MGYSMRPKAIEGWPNTAALLADWRRVHGPEGCDFVLDGRPLPVTPLAPVRGLWITKCTQNTVMSYITQGRLGLVL